MRTHTSRRRHTFLTLILLLSLLIVLPPSTAVAQTSGVISGSVTADQGVVRAFRVKARDTVHRISYTVYTVAGRYQIFNLPPSTYDVQVIEDGFEPLVQTTTVSAGNTATVDLALTSTGVVSVSGAAAGAAAGQENYGRRARLNPAGARLVSFDELYPPHPTREIMLRSCFGCHGPAGFHNRGPMNEAGWQRAVHRMFDADGRVANMNAGVPQITYDTVSREEETAIIQYLTENFGPGSEKRDLLLDPLVRDEQALSQAVYVQYELNRMDRPPVEGARTSGSIHSVFASLQHAGVIWVSGNGSNEIIRVDTNDLNFDTRTKEYWIDNADNINVTPHGILELGGKVYWVELTGDHLGELDPDTGEISRFPFPTTGAGAHSAWADSRGNVWYTYFASAGRIGRFNTRTKEFTEWEQPDGWRRLRDRRRPPGSRVGRRPPHPCDAHVQPGNAGVDVVSDDQPSATPDVGCQWEDLGRPLLREHDHDDRPGDRRGDLIRAAVEGRESVRHLVRQGQQPLDRERNLQLDGEVRPDHQGVYILPVPRAARPHPQAGSGPSGRDVVHAAEFVWAGDRHPQTTRERPSGKIGSTVAVVRHQRSVTPA